MTDTIYTRCRSCKEIVGALQPTPDELELLFPGDTPKPELPVPCPYETVSEGEICTLRKDGCNCNQ